MRLDRGIQKVAGVMLLCLLLWSTGCSNTPSTAPPPAKPAEPVYAMVDVQKLLEQHPSRAKLRQLEQALASAEAADNDKTALINAARQEFEAAMKIRQNQDNAALEKKQSQLEEQLNAERKQFIDNLEAEYRPLLFNIELKLKAVQQSPTELNALQQEKNRLEAERQQKLKNKDEALSARFKQEMDAFAKELAGKSETYAKQWMDERMQEIHKPVVSPEREKQRQEVANLSARMIQDIKAAVTKTAEKNKISIVWLKQAVRKPVKDITDEVSKELINGK